MPEAPARRALITGISGFLGSNLAAHLSRRGWEVWGTWHAEGPGPTAHSGATTRHLDVCLPDAVAALMDESRPDVVFHLAALADPDACAKDEPATRQINVQGAKLVARAALTHGARMVFTSTDQVFDGTKALWTENDMPAPLGVYGRSKHDAEKAVLDTCGDKALVVRLALTYGWGRGPAKGRNFSELWLKAFLTGGRVRAFTDQWRSPIYAGDACEALRRGAEENWHGLLHLAGPERATRYDFGCRLAREFGFPEAALHAASLSDAVFLDPRPADASLGTDKLRSLGILPLGLDAGLKAMHQELEQL